MGTTEHADPESTPETPRGRILRGWLAADGFADLLLFAASVNLLSLPLAGGLSLPLGPWTLASPSFGISAAVWLAAATVRFRRRFLDADVGAIKAWLGAHRYALTVACLTLAGLALRIISIDFGMPLVVHVDEPSVVGVAVEQLRSGWIDPQWYVYPTFFINLMLPALAIYYVYARGHGTIGPLADVRSTAPGFYLVGRYHSAILGALTITLTYALGKRLLGGERGRRAGLIAAAIVTFSFIHVRESHYAVTDVPTGAVVTGALLAIAGVLHRGSTRDYLAAGFLCGLAASTKYTAAPIVLSFAAAHLAGRRVGEWHRQPLWSGMLAIPAGFIFGSPYSLLNWEPFLEHLGWLGGFAGNPVPTDVRSNFGYILGYGAESGFGLPVFVLLLLAVVWALYRRRPAELILVAFILGSIPQMTQTTHNFYPRFLVPLVPAAAVLVGGLVVDVIDALRSRQILAQRAAAAVFGLALVLLPATTVGESIRWLQVRGRQDTRAAAYEWIRERFPQGVVIATEVDIVGAPRTYRVLDLDRPLDVFSVGELASEEVGVVILAASYDAIPRSDELRAARLAFKQELGGAARFEGFETGVPGPTIEVYLLARR